MRQCVRSNSLNESSVQAQEVQEYSTERRVNNLFRTVPK
jgi:hypothetical protein